MNSINNISDQQLEAAKAKFYALLDTLRAEWRAEILGLAGLMRIMTPEVDSEDADLLKRFLRESRDKLCAICEIDPETGTELLAYLIANANL